MLTKISMLLFALFGLLLLTIQVNGDREAEGFDEDDQEEAIKTHNMYRSKEGASNMNKLVWSDALEKLATHWAIKCSFEHGQVAHKLNLPFIGQNLYVSSNQKVNVSQAIKRWFDEKLGYNYDEDNCRQGICGHYLQVVWAKSKLVGCGFKVCSRLKLSGGAEIKEAVIIVCNYDQGVMSDTKPYLLGEACSKCSSGTKCQQKLCV